MVSPDSIRIVTVIAFFVLLAMGIRRPLWAGIGYMILVYCKVSEYYPVFAAMQAELIFGLLILLRVLASGRFQEKLSLHYNSVNKYMLLFIGCMSLSFVLAMDHKYSWDNAVYHLIKSLLLSCIILIAIEDERDIKTFVWGFVIIFAYLAYEPVYHFITQTGGDTYWYGTNYISDVGILSGHVKLANNMNQMIPIAAFLILPVRNKVLKVLSTIPLLLFFTAVVGSNSRGGLAGLAFFFCTLVYFSKHRLRNAIILVMLVTMIFAFSHNLKHTGSRINEGSVAERLIGMIQGVEMVRVYGNILGVGPGCFALARGKYFGYTMEAHNIYGEIIGDLGIPGAIVWCLLIVQVFRNFSESRKQLTALSMENEFLYKLTMGLEISLIVRLFISLASHGLYYIYWYLLPVLSIAVLKLVEKKTEEATRKH